MDFLMFISLHPENADLKIKIIQMRGF